MDPEERYEVVVASLHQQPADPAGAVSTHRAVDYWGRQLVDQLIAKLPDALAPEGVAYVMQLSLLSQQRTAELLDAAGFRAEVVDWSMFGARAVRRAPRTQIERVEELSDAYHLRVGDATSLVAYLLEITAKATARARRRDASRRRRPAMSAASHASARGACASRPVLEAARLADARRRSARSSTARRPRLPRRSRSTAAC